MDRARKYTNISFKYKMPHEFKLMLPVKNSGLLLNSSIYTHYLFSSTFRILAVRTQSINQSIKLQCLTIIHLLYPTRTHSTVLDNLTNITKTNMIAEKQWHFSTCSPPPHPSSTFYISPESMLLGAVLYSPSLSSTSDAWSSFSNRILRSHRSWHWYSLISYRLLTAYAFYIWKSVLLGVQYSAHVFFLEYYVGFSIFFQQKALLLQNLKTIKCSFPHKALALFM